jgi:large subunit ribosomal protein L21
MKKAIIATGGKQYLVSEGELLSVELVKDSKDGKISFEPLLVIDGDKTTVGTPSVAGVSVAAEIVNEDEQDDKVTSIRYKAKKRVHTVRGHRQHKTLLKISKIA